MHGGIIAGILIVIIIVAGLFMFGMYPQAGEVLTRADITEVLGIWVIEFPEAEGLCRSEGGDWHHESDWWGCEGVGFENMTMCTSEIGEILKIQCEGMGAEWVCDRNDVYCKYE